jgi:peptide/nickel transport system substrate-binding protein
MERFLSVTRAKFTTYYQGIVGADRCVRRPARCDLSAGIETDARARTIAVHLTRPDEEFLHKLTLQFAYVVPADTPRRATGERLLPGTGPYRFESWDAERGGQLVRNPRFRSWSPARPAGFANRIEVSLRKRGVRAQVADVQSGAADLTILASPFGTRFPPQRFGALEVRSPGQLHSYPEAALNFMFLNVRRPPFDDPRSRQALNYGTDRARIVELEGGPDIVSPTCQILPSGFPGHKLYCPYTAQSGPGRQWSAPDTERARALVDESGTSGERVVVTVPDSKRDIGRYFTALLDRLGYRASLRVLSDDEYWPEIIQDPPNTRAQIAFIGWSLDYASASTFIEPNFGCPDNLSHFCDRHLMREIGRARAARGTDAAGRWAAIDRRVTDLAPAVPLTNSRSVDLVSKRVGNVQHHVLGFTLLDQLWVR